MLKEIKTESEHYFVDDIGLRQGEYRNYHVNGHPWEHFFYLNGKIHGGRKMYHDNGQLSIHCFYQNGELHGEYHRYDENGQLCEHLFHQNGNLHGEYYMYDENGNLIRSTFYYHDHDLKVDPSTLTEKDKAYILLSGRLPPRD